MKYAKHILVSIIVAMSVVALSGCGKADQMYAHYTGKAYEVCQDGVLYLQFTSGATVKYLPNGQIATCK